MNAGFTGLKNEKHLVWSNKDLDIEDGWREAYAEFLEINNLDKDPKDEQAIYEYMVETNDEYLYDERANLGRIQFDKPIIAIADLGLWDGRHSGYQEIESGKIVDCLTRMNDYDTWYVDAKGDFRCDSIHHDGTNHILYRTFKDDITELQIQNFKNKIYDGILSETDIEQYTRRVGDEIAKVYGWEFSKEQPQLTEMLANAQDRADKGGSGCVGKEAYVKE